MTEYLFAEKLKTENRFKYVATEGCSFREVMQRYEEWLNSPKQLKSRSYRMEGITDLANVWTEERIEKFKIAFKKYGYGPTSNRKIAEYIGEDIHPNHVAYYKHRYKKRLIKEGRFEELECVAGIKVHKIKKLKERYQEQQSREEKAKETLKKSSSEVWLNCKEEVSPFPSKQKKSVIKIDKAMRQSQKESVVGPFINS